jgi:hypothetical protein
MASARLAPSVVRWGYTCPIQNQRTITPVLSTERVTTRRGCAIIVNVCCPLCELSHQFTIIVDRAP